MIFTYKGEEYVGVEKDKFERLFNTTLPSTNMILTDGESLKAITQKSYKDIVVGRRGKLITPLGGGVETDFVVTEVRDDKVLVKPYDNDLLPRIVNLTERDNKWIVESGDNSYTVSWNKQEKQKSKLTVVIGRRGQLIYTDENGKELTGFVVSEVEDDKHVDIEFDKPRNLLIRKRRLGFSSKSNRYSISLKSTGKWSLVNQPKYYKINWDDDTTDDNVGLDYELYEGQRLTKHEEEEREIFEGKRGRIIYNLNHSNGIVGFVVFMIGGKAKVILDRTTDALKGEVYLVYKNDRWMVEGKDNSYTVSWKYYYGGYKGTTLEGDVDVEGRRGQLIYTDEKNKEWTGFTVFGLTTNTKTKVEVKLDVDRNIDGERGKVATITKKNDKWSVVGKEEFYSVSWDKDTTGEEHSL